MITKHKSASREEWLQFRRGYIGGSDAGTVVGLNPYSSPYALWAEKTGRIPGFEGNIITTVGSYLEDLVTKLFEEDTGKSVRRSNFSYVNDKYPYACADVDRLVVGEDALLEIKTTNSIPAMRQIRGGEFPDQWWCQITHYMAVLEIPHAYLAVLVGCRELHIYELDRDPDEEAALMAAEQRFWQHVTDDTPPAIDGSDATSNALKDIYISSDDDFIPLIGRDGLLDEYLQVKADIRQLENRQQEIENILKNDIGEHAGGDAAAYTVSWKGQTRRTFDTKRFAADHPGLQLDAYYNTSFSRPFKVTKRKEK